MKPILSNDPYAIEKLQEKIKNLESMQERMKTINKLYKKHGRKAFEMIELTDNEQHNIEYNLATPYYKNIPYPAFYLSNNNAAIKNAKSRLNILLKKQGK